MPTSAATASRPDIRSMHYNYVSKSYVKSELDHLAALRVSGRVATILGPLFHRPPHRCPDTTSRRMIQDHLPFLRIAMIVDRIKRRGNSTFAPQLTAVGHNACKPLVSWPGR
ncbi:hypothetical protein KC341_g78 [Hortaea werneckii]|nr:hypothetical protein KC341_g78 [Hortaea werneckii]